MFKTIIVGTDGSDTARDALTRAMELATSMGATLDIVSAYQPVSGARLQAESKEAPEDMQWAISPTEEVEKVLQAAADEAVAAGIEVRTHAREGDPADAILQVAEEQGADCIVVGNKGMTGTKRFLLGSVPNKISHHAPCCVLIAKTT